MIKTRTANQLWIYDGYILVLAPDNIKSKHKHREQRSEQNIPILIPSNEEKKKKKSQDFYKGSS